MKNIYRTLTYCIATVFVLSANIFGQGYVDSTFGTNGTTTFSVPGEQVAGAVMQRTISFKDRIVVGSSISNEFRMLRLQSTGAVDSAFGTSPPRAISLFGGGITVIAVGIATDQNDNLFVAGNSSNFRCLISKFNPNGLSPNNLVLPMPTGTDQCQVWGVKGFGNHIYVLAGTIQTAGTMAVTVYRINAATFALDTTWNATGYVRTVLGVTIGGASSNSFAIDVDVLSNKVFVTAAQLQGFVGSNALIGYDSLGNVLTSGFGTVKPDFTPGFGVYRIPNFVARDMLIKAERIYLGGATNSNNFELVKVSPNGASHSSYTTVDLNGKEGIHFLALNNFGKILAGGTSELTVSGLTKTYFGLAKYNDTGNSLTTTWTPSFLQVLRYNAAPPVLAFPILTGDRRSLTRYSELVPNSVFAQAVLMQSAPSPNRIILVSSFPSNKDNIAVTGIRD